jgi:hypothetical protein
MTWITSFNVFLLGGIHTSDSPMPLLNGVIEVFDASTLVMALTTDIEADFQRQLNTGTLFVNLTAANDTVWIVGLMPKFMDSVPCLKLCSLLDNMLVNLYFQL